MSGRQRLEMSGRQRLEVCGRQRLEVYTRQLSVHVYIFVCVSETRSICTHLEILQPSLYPPILMVVKERIVIVWGAM